MPILGFYNNNMSSKHSLLDFREQASIYIKEKIKTARLALTDVTPAQLLTEEATNANPRPPNTQTLRLISRATFEIDDYWRIVDILHNKLSKFDRKKWRVFYNALIVLEYLLTHGPESVADEFQTEKPMFKNMESFQLVDEKGFNWGLATRKKSERILKLLEKGPFLKKERDQARKVTREIKGFGSFPTRSNSPLEESSALFRRSQSQFVEHGKDQKFSQSKSYELPELISLSHDLTTEKFSSVKKVYLDENMTSRNAITKEETHVWSKNNNDSNVGERIPFLCDTNAGVSIEHEDHPFKDSEKNCRVSLLSATIDQY